MYSLTPYKIKLFDLRLQVMLKMWLSIGLDDVVLWMAIISLILLITNEFVATRQACHNLIIEKRRFKNVTTLTVLLFLSMVAARIFIIVFTSG